jgi:PhzF family phenazine biosynthesis protein
MHRFSQVDVFTDRLTSGNALAVVHDADDLGDAQLAAIASWTNLSETTFLLRPTDPDADYRVRIFTTEGELPFAGHPTLGSAYAWSAAGGEARDPARIVQQCDLGLVPVRVDLNASLAQWLIGAGRLPSAYVAAQGTVLGRRGRVHVRAEGSQVWVGGQVTPGVSGTIAL